MENESPRLLSARPAATGNPTDRAEARQHERVRLGFRNGSSNRHDAGAGRLQAANMRAGGEVATGKAVEGGADNLERGALAHVDAVDRLAIAVGVECRVRHE